MISSRSRARSLATVFKITVSTVALLLTALVGEVRADAPPWVGKFVSQRVVVGSSPDNTFALISRVLNTAKTSIHISVYELDNPFVGDLLEKAVDRGVAVRILLEGAPIPKIPQNELYIASRLVKKGAKVLFYDDPDGRSQRRFKYFHNKYTIADGKRVLVGSANYGSNGHPVDNSTGNREWEVVLDDPKAADLFEEAFRHDSSAQTQWATYGSSPKFTLEDPNFVPNRKTRSGHYSLDLSPAVATDVPVKTLFAPDNSIKGDEGGESPMLHSLEMAKATVAVEQLNFETYWGNKPYNPDKEESPMMKTILALARAGRAIRILLNDDGIFRMPTTELSPEFAPQILPTTFADRMTPSFLPDVVAISRDPSSGGPPERNNDATLKFLNRIAKSEGLDLTVRLLDYRNCGLGVLHNKGMIIDREVTMVGSLNWGESALKFNREAGVMMKSTEIAGYYTRTFDYDWQCSQSR